jgi:hypothetical protein
VFGYADCHRNNRSSFWNVAWYLGKNVYTITINTYIIKKFNFTKGWELV